MKKNHLHNWLLLTTIFLSACGGGGNNGNLSISGFNTGSGFNGTVHSVVPANDGSGDIYVGGDFSAYNGNAANRLVRLNSDGSIDTGFNTGSGFNSRVKSIALATDGSGAVYFGGDFSAYNGSSANKLIRLTIDGSTDTGFDTGTGFDNSTGSSIVVLSIALATDGSGDVYVGGEFTHYRGNVRNHIVRINSNGSNDADFDPGTGFDEVVNSIALATDGSGDVYAGGLFSNYRGNVRNHIVRINGDGSNDAGFDPGTGFDFEVKSITLATDGSGDIYAGGVFNAYRGNIRVSIARINSDGSNDAGFNPGTGFTNTAAKVFSIAVATDGSGDVYAGGVFDVYRGNSRVGIVRINSDGSNDAGFDSGTGFGSLVASIALAADGSGDIYAGGTFTDYRGSNRNRIARINSDGSDDF